MSFLKKLNQRIVGYANHPQAMWIFFLCSFLSGSFIPLPIDPLFMVLAMQQPKKVPTLVVLGAAGITLGGLVMYAIGYAFYLTAGVWLIQTYQWEDSFLVLQKNVALYGGWLIILKTFTPIPYKLLAMVAGIAHLNLLIFVGASMAGRMLRLTTEGFVLRFVSDPLKDLLQRHLSLGLGVFFLLVLLLTLFIPFLIRL